MSLFFIFTKERNKINIQYECNEPSFPVKFESIILLLTCSKTNKKEGKKNHAPALSRQSIDKESAQIVINDSDNDIETEKSDTEVISRKVKLS
jgi:hypothetical protein